MKGIDGSTEELSEGKTILFLGYRRQLYGRKYSYSIGHGSTTLRRLGVQTAFKGCLRRSCRYCEFRTRLQMSTLDRVHMLR